MLGFGNESERIQRELEQLKGFEDTWRRDLAANRKACMKDLREFEKRMQSDMEDLRKRIDLNLAEFERYHYSHKRIDKELGKLKDIVMQIDSSRRQLLKNRGQLTGLNEQELEVLRLLQDNLTQEQIGKKLKLTRARINQVVASLKKKKVMTVYGFSPAPPMMRKDLLSDLQLEKLREDNEMNDESLEDIPLEAIKSAMRKPRKHRNRAE